MFDFTVCEQQNLANSLFGETLELEKYLKKIGALTKGGPRPPLNPPLIFVFFQGVVENWYCISKKESWNNPEMLHKRSNTFYTSVPYTI